jgi:DNA primase
MADQIEEVKSKIDIVSVIGSFIDLKKAGRNFKANCPFHGEKTPSFMVSPELQIYKCFGCGESGDVISFLEKYEGMEFYEALKYLADSVGIKLETSGFHRRSDNDKLYQLNQYAKKFYEYILLNHKAGKLALSYLETKRGLTIEIIKQFGIGFCPDLPFAVKSYLVDKKKFSLDDIERAGIVFKGQRGYVDRFRGRVVFPLYDHRGNVCGFAGRILPGKEKYDVAKYINTPETPIYHKSNLLYGLETTKQEIKKKGEVVVVEGELDLISSYKAGIKNIVALKGSAFTTEQAKLLGRYAKKVILSLDADFAGDAAARRGITIAEGEGLEVSVVELEGFKDPDDIARKDPEKYKNLLANPVGVWDFIIDTTVLRYDTKSGAGKLKIGKELVPILAAISNDIVKAHYIAKVAAKLNVPEEAVIKEVEKTSTDSIKRTTILPNEGQNAQVERREILERSWLSLLLQGKTDKIVDRKLTKNFQSPIIKKILDELQKFTKSRSWSVKNFSKSLPQELRKGFNDIYLENGLTVDYDKGERKKELTLIENELKILEIREKMSKLTSEIGKLEAEKKFTLLTKRQKDFAELSNTLSDLEKT